MLLFCLQGNSKVVMLMGILLPNVMKEWHFESLQRPCNILYLLHHHPSIFIDTSIIFRIQKSNKNRRAKKYCFLGSTLTCQTLKMSPRVLTVQVYFSSKIYRPSRLIFSVNFCVRVCEIRFFKGNI